MFRTRFLSSWSFVSAFPLILCSFFSVTTIVIHHQARSSAGVGNHNNTKSHLDLQKRLSFEESMNPFYHGVASGDPLENAVILWTRVTTTDAETWVYWEISTDPFENGSTTGVVNSGISTTTADRDYTVKVDATGLEPNTYYYYRFTTPRPPDRPYDPLTDEYEDLVVSVVGRTKTAPDTVNDSTRLRFAVVSCSHFQRGYFHAYDRIVERNDVDAVLHLGDYIYEYGPGEYGGFRDHEPNRTIVTLMDYRTRYAQYRLDPSMQRVHQNYPWIVTWDDHEMANNAYRDGAENHDEETEGSWEARKAAVIQAYREWLPIRILSEDDDLSEDFDENATPKIYRKLRYGSLAEIFVLDTRLIARDEQSSILRAFLLSFSNHDRSRDLLGPEQRQWLLQGLQDSDAQWKVIAQQVLVSPLGINLLFGFFALNPDAWDGYTVERRRVFDFIEENNIDNVVILTGDLHLFLIAEAPFRSIFRSVEENSFTSLKTSTSLAVEFLTTAVTSDSLEVYVASFFGLGGFPRIVRLLGYVLQWVMLRFNPHIKYINAGPKGYSILDIDQHRAKSNAYDTGDIENPNETKDELLTAFYTEDGTNTLQQNDNEPSWRDLSSFPISQSPDVLLENNLSPSTSNRGSNTETLAKRPSLVTITGLYPNPFVAGEEIWIQYFVHDTIVDSTIDIRSSLRDDSSLIGEKMIIKNGGTYRECGPYLHRMVLPESLSTGVYSVEITARLFRDPSGYVVTDDGFEPVSTKNFVDVIQPGSH